MAATTKNNGVEITHDDADQILERLRKDPTSPVPRDVGTIERWGGGAVSDSWNALTSKDTWGGVGDLFSSMRRYGDRKDERAAAVVEDDGITDFGRKVADTLTTNPGDKEKLDQLVNEGAPQYTDGIFGMGGLFAMALGALGLVGGKMLGGGGGLLALLGAASAIGYTVYKNHMEIESYKKPRATVAEEALRLQQEREKELAKEKQREAGQEEPAASAGLSAETIAAARAAAVSSGAVIADSTASTPVVARNNNINKGPAGRTA